MYLSSVMHRSVVFNCAGQELIPVWQIYINILSYPPHNKVVGVYWFHPVRPSVRPFRIPFPLCSAYSSGWIYFMFIHLIKQIQKVCRLWSYLQNLNIWHFLKFNFDFVLFWRGIWCESLVWLIMGRRGVSHNAGVLVFKSLHLNCTFRKIGHPIFNWITVTLIRWWKTCFFVVFVFKPLRAKFLDGTETFIYILCHPSTLTWHS